ncbi:MAG: DinB family protein [Mycobacteriales bacterium]
MPTPKDDRTDPPAAGDERALLDGYLDYHRQTLLWKCAGLTADQLRERPIPPSQLSLHGLVRHLADVERSWFRERFAGQDVPDLFYLEDNPDADFLDTADADPEADLALYRGEVAAVRATVRDRGLDETFTSPKGQTYSLRWLYLHMIEEYARHNGHADLIRERIDGATGE